MSKLVVGSSNAKIEQLMLKLSASANLITILANTFYPIEHLPFISNLVSL